MEINSVIPNEDYEVDLLNITSSTSIDATSIISELHSMTEGMRNLHQARSIEGYNIPQLVMTPNETT